MPAGPGEVSAENSTESTARDRAPEVDGAGVDADNPWLGLASFTEESRAYYFGRDEEVTELARRVQRKLLTVLFGKSGLGKTSLLRAGLVPRLRARGYFPVYLRIDYAQDSPEPAEQIKQAVARAAALGQWTRSGVAAQGESIWEFLHHRDDVLQDASGTTLTPLLIFDQFEELFTLAQGDEFGRARAARFVEELADLVENRPPRSFEARLDADESLAERFDFARSDYRVLIALREDYLAPLEGLKKAMPSLSQNRLRLAPMTGSQALEAVLRPGRHLVSQEVAEAIVRFVAGGAELTNAEVEPSLLSLICRELNEQRIAEKRSEISQDLLAGSHDTILSTFYERSLADQPESVRRIIEDDLLTESGYRENLSEESLLRRFQAAGAAPDALAQLVNRRLLRIEERLDVRRVELTHDVLTGVVKASRDERHEREGREATERTLAEQRDRERAARQALRRARAIAAGCLLLAAIAIAGVILAFVGVKRARRAERLAQHERMASEQARGQGEALLGFLTNHLSRELSTFGRYQTIAELSQREIDYFQRLPPQLKDADAVRSAALALTQHAHAESFLGNEVLAARNVTKAVALLHSLRRTDQSEATAISLGRAYAVSGLVAWNQGFGARATTRLRRAVNLLRPQAERAGASEEARHAYFTALQYFGFVGMATLPSEQEAQLTRTALRVMRQLGTADHGGVIGVAQYASVQAELARALVSLGRLNRARREAEDAITGLNRALARRPQYGLALLFKALADRVLVEAAQNELDPVRATRFASQMIQAARALVHVEPGNQAYASWQSVAYAEAGDAMWAAGRLRQAIHDDQKSVMLGRKISADSGLSLENLGYMVTTTAARQARLGDFEGAASTGAFLSPSALRMPGPIGKRLKAVIATAQGYPEAVVAYERGDFAGARRIAHDAVRRLQDRHGKDLQYALTKPLLCRLAEIDGRAEYRLSAFSAAATAEHLALQTCAAQRVSNHKLEGRRLKAQAAVWLSMALAGEGKPEEAARTITPTVRWYRGLEERNHGDQWLPLEFAETLYAQSLTDPRQRAALLQRAGDLVNHLPHAIARLHDTRQWRARIEAAQRTDRVAARR